jgi:hypothetical protein
MARTMNLINGWVAIPDDSSVCVSVPESSALWYG